MAESDESGDGDFERANPKRETVWRLLRDNDGDPAELLHTYPNFDVRATPEGARFIYLREACMRSVKRRVVHGLVACGASFTQVGAQGVSPFAQACISANCLPWRTVDVEWILETFPEARDAVSQVTRKKWRGRGETLDRSPLEIASQTNNHVLVRLLLRFGVDFERTNDCGRTPAQHARWWADRGRPALGARLLNTCSRMSVVEVANILELADTMRCAGEWRPRTHACFPVECRRTMRTLLLLAKSYLPRDDDDGGDVVKEIKPRYPGACLSMLPEEILQYLFAYITCGPFPDAWFECVRVDANKTE